MVAEPLSQRPTGCSQSAPCSPALGSPACCSGGWGGIAGPEHSGAARQQQGWTHTPGGTRRSNCDWQSAAAHWKQGSDRGAAPAVRAGCRAQLRLPPARREPYSSMQLWPHSGPDDSVAAALQRTNSRASSPHLASCSRRMPACWPGDESVCRPNAGRPGHCSECMAATPHPHLARLPSTPAALQALRDWRRQEAEGRPVLMPWRSARVAPHAATAAPPPAPGQACSVGQLGQCLPGVQLLHA